MMSSKAFFIVCMVLSVRGGVVAEVWEFGTDAPGSIIVEYQEGAMTIFQRHREINLRTPHCYEIEYVRVQVDNSISTPSVKYNMTMATVSIKYNQLQYSVSRYTIIAKAVRVAGCYSGNAEL